MRLSIATILACPLLIVCQPVASLSGLDKAPLIQEPAKQNPQPARKIQTSDKAVVKDIVYGLEAEENQLYLTSQPLDGVDRQLERGQLKFDVPDGANVVELSLAKLDGKNLMAVIKIAHGNEYEFHCLTFIAPRGGHVRGRYGFHQAKFFTTLDSLKILATGGKHFAGSVFIVLGDIVSDETKDDEKKEFVSVTKGVFYFSGCPWPPSDGQLSPFRVESVTPNE